MISIYKIVSAVLVLARQFFLQNPFDVLSDNIATLCDDNYVWLVSVIVYILNVSFEPILYFSSKKCVGLFYRSGTMPVFGSLLYMFFYCVHHTLLKLMMGAYPVSWIMFIILIGYLVLLGLVYKAVDLIKQRIFEY